MTIVSRQPGAHRKNEPRLIARTSPHFTVELLDVLLVLRSCAEHYPPTVNQANLLAESGLRAGVIDLSVEGAANALSGSIRRWRVHRMWNSKLESPYPIWKRWINWLRFRRTCQSVIAQSRPRVVIAYDTLGSLFVPPNPNKYRTVYHFHELTGPHAGEGFGPRRARLKAAQSSRDADLVVFPDADRAGIFQKSAGLRTAPRVVMNCPRRMASVPCSPLRQTLAEVGASDGAAVCYLGSIGSDQGLPEAARSMSHWPVDSRFVLIGGASESMRKSILDAAASAGAAGRVVFLGLRSHAEALALAAGADVGLALIQPNNESWLYSAGAINKRFEYMALGVPQVTNNGPGVAEIIEGARCGLCVDSRDPAAIGAAVRQLLDSPLLRREMWHNARTEHLADYNYESQYYPVLEWVRQTCRVPH
jgi:glycosyltransferase involved in cell wall biosynthesis